MADPSQVFALASVWLLILGFGSSACLLPIIYTVAQAYQDAFSSGVSYINQGSTIELLAPINTMLFMLFGSVVGYPIASASGVKVPLSILGAEIDRISPPELIKQFEAALNAKPEVDSFVKIFTGCSHGWSVRYKGEDEAAVKSAEEAHKDMMEWFVKHLSPAYSL